MQVRAEKGKQFSEYTLPQRLNTDNKTTSDYNCGQPVTIVTPATNNSLFTLTPGDTFSSSDFKVVVIEVTSAQNGMFTGRGMMSVNSFNGASIEVSFSGNINNNYELTTGSVVSVYEQGSEMAQITEEMQKIGEKKKEEQKSETPNSPQKVDITITGIIDTVYINDEGKIVVMNEGGDETTYEQKKDEKTGAVQETVIADTSGNTYTVGKDGKVTKDSANSSSLASANVKNNLINFKQAGNQLYGFDQIQYDAHANNYEKVTINGTEALVSWKSVASGSTDKVIAWSDKKENLFDEVNYQSLSGDVPKQKSENGVEITVTSTGHEQVSEIEAYSKNGSKENKKTVIGRLNVISYDPIVRNLVLVPVNGATIPSNVSLTNELNKIFGPAIVTWNITPANDLKVELGSDGKLDDGSSGLLSNYTNEMREVIREFKAGNDIVDETYYLFFVGEGETQPRKDGYMPRKKQCGFIFTNGLNQEILAKTIAHELAHGAFRLEHTFETYPSLTKGTTDNLMDYNTGTRLHKYQWDLVHDPVAVWGLFEGDEEGAAYDCPMWFSGECEDVGRVLDLIKDLSARGSKMLTRSPKNPDKKELIAENIELDGTEFRKIRIINLVEKDKEYNYDPREYEEYDQPYLDAEGRSDIQRGFIYRSGPATTIPGGLLTTPAPIIVKVLLYEDEDKFDEKEEALRKYLFGTSKVEPKTDNTLVPTATILEYTETATEVASKWTTATACNACVRAALYLIKNDSVLFPTGGSAYHDPKNNYTERQIKGYISPDGRAKFIKADFDDLSNKSELNERFVQIDKGEKETWPTYFERLQSEADKGRIIIGTMLNSSGTQGHVVMITPGGLITIDDSEDAYGDSFVSNGITKVPRILECGGEDRENDAPLCRNVDRRGALERLKWFKYTK